MAFKLRVTKGLAVSAALAAGLGGIAALPALAQAQPTISRLCVVDQVAVIDQRVHIKCAVDNAKAFTQAITYYAMPLSEGDTKVSAVIALGIGAKQTGKPMVLWFNPDDYKSVPGCQGTNCRRLHGAALE